MCILIQRQGDWVSACYREYISLPRDKALTATRDMLHLVSSQLSVAALLNPLLIAEAPLSHVFDSEVRLNP